MSNIVYVGCSIDGYIADKNEGLEWLNSVPNPGSDDCGWNDFMSRMDAIVMGRKTFEKVCSFDCDWPYKMPVFVLSNSMKSVPENYADKVEMVNGNLKEIVKKLNEKGFKNLYIDGGVTIQSFLKEDLIDELIISVIPILLGGGFPLFSEMEKSQSYEYVETKVFLNQIVQNHYKRKRD